MKYGVAGMRLATPWFHYRRRFSVIGNAFAQTRLGQA